SPKKRMALAEAATSKGIRAGHIYSRTLLRGLASAGYLQLLYGDTFEISPKGLAWIVSHGHPTPRHAIGASRRTQHDPPGIYNEFPGIEAGDFVIYQDHRGMYRVDLITSSSGKHVTIG